jgi:hypothetical protein
MKISPIEEEEKKKKVATQNNVLYWASRLVDKQVGS